MSASTGPEFVVANVLVYAFDSSAKAKQAAARELIERLWESGTGCLSVQVLQEFFVQRHAEGRATPASGGSRGPHPRVLGLESLRPERR
jgi:predicted nucleic acid-binding protein